MSVNLNSVELGFDLVALKGGHSLLSRVVDCDHEVSVSEQDQLHGLL